MQSYTRWENSKKTVSLSLEMMRINWNFLYFWQKVSTQLRKDLFIVQLKIVQFAIKS